MTKIPKQVLKAGHILQSYYLVVLFKLLVNQRKFSRMKQLRQRTKNNFLKEEPPKEAIEKVKVIDKKLIKF